MKNKSKMFSSWSEMTGMDRNQVVFEQLNKTYGAYEIRTNYDRTLLKAFSSAVLLIMLISGFSFLSSTIKPAILIPDTPATPVDPPYVIPPVVPPVIPPVIPPGSPKTASNELTDPIVTTDSIMKTDSVPALPFNPTTTTVGRKDSSNTGAGEPKTTGTAALTDTTFEGPFISDPPTFPGGDKALFSFLQKNISYPESVKEIGGKGIVAISFVLDKEGNVTEVLALKASKYSELNQEAVRVIKKLPKWNPGKQQGNAVKVRMILPIRFELKQ